MKEKLEAMSVEALLKLKYAIEDTLLKKMPKLIKVGSLVTFQHSGRVIVMRVTRVNPKTLSGVETDKHGNAYSKGKWRVSPNLVRLFTPEVKVSGEFKPTGVGADRPASAVPSW